jgi:hypothetical protein
MELLSTSPDLAGGGMWIMDRACPTCRRCGRPFTPLFRRHHCRICGFVFCHACADHFIDPDLIPDVLKTDHVRDDGTTTNVSFHDAPSDAGDLIMCDRAEGDGDDLFQLDLADTCPVAQPHAQPQAHARTPSPPTATMMTIPEEASDGSIAAFMGMRVSQAWRHVVQTVSRTVRNGNVRVCDACMHAVVRANHSRRLVDVFSVNPFLSSEDYCAIARVCRAWSGAARVLRRVWKDTIIPFAPQTRDVQLQRRLILQHRDVRTSRVAVVCAKHGVAQSRARAWVPQLSIAECMQVIVEVPATHPLQKVARRGLVAVDSERLLPFVNVLVVLAGDLDPRLWRDVLAHHARACREFAFRVYWYARARTAPSQRALARRVAGAASAADQAAFRLTGTWATALRLLCSDGEDAAAGEGVGGGVPEVLGRPVLFPGTCRTRVLRVHAGTMRKIPSSSCPVVFQMDLEDVATRAVRRRTVMVKRDRDFWNEVCVLNVHEHVANTHPDVRRLIHLYAVCPLAADVGLVVFVDGAASLYDLRQNGRSVLQHVVRTAPRDATVPEMEATFRQSVAFACVMALMLGYGDRHLGNLIIADGRLMHIDYGFILSREPDSKRFLPTPHSVRLTPELLDTIGPEFHAVFLDECTRTNVQLRSCAHAVYYLLYPLVQSYASHDDIVMHLRTFVRPGCRIEHVDTVLKTVIGSTTMTSSTALTWLLDTVHWMGQYVGS